jgi:hypothetical protein
VRSLLLQLLAEYRTEGIFPRNPDFAEPTPYFIDARGVPCAMAHLLLLSGEQAMVSKIARERNSATVAQLADEARLIAWLSAAGLTVAEAAAIQPFYCEAVSDCYCYGGLYGSQVYPRFPGVPDFRVETVARGQLVANSPGGWSVLVQDVYGNCARTSVGETLQRVNFAGAPASPEMRPGQVVLVGLTVGRNGVPLPNYNGVVVNGDETIACSPSAISATATELTAAVLSSDCAGTLTAIDPRWSARSGPRCDAGVADA